MWARLRRLLLVNPDKLSTLPKLRTSETKGFRFPAPASQPQPEIARTPDVAPATSLSRNPYYKRASQPPTFAFFSRTQVQAELDKVKAPWDDGKVWYVGTPRVFTKVGTTQL